MELYWLGHAGFKIRTDEIVCYIDPFQIDEQEHATYVFITHPHQDHLDLEALDQIVGPDTLVVCTPDARSKLAKLDCEEIITVRPGQRIERDGLIIETHPAYNKTKKFHPQSEGWVGYRIIFEEGSVYHMGDTDELDELAGIKADIILIPVSGTYVMNPDEAATMANQLTYERIIPMHYGSIVGTEADAEAFERKTKRAIIPTLGEDILTTDI